MSTKVLVSVFILFFFVSLNARAEYYIAYSAPECCSKRVVKKHHYVRHYKHPKAPVCHYKKPHKKHYRHYSRSHYSIQVYYYNYSMYPPCPCQCGGCAPTACTCCSNVKSSCGQRSSMVNYSGQPTSYRGARYYTNEETIPPFFLDRSTADDDSNAYPDMNIDH